MGIFGSLFGKKKVQSLSLTMRDTLFGDMPLAQWPSESSVQTVDPWTAFAAARNAIAAGNPPAAIAAWQKVIEHPGLESRVYLQAWHFLRLYGEKPAAEISKLVLGIVVEIGMPNGLDLLAAYTDYSVRYYNFSNKAIIWEHPNPSLDPLITGLLDASRQVVVRIGPWEKPRLPAPTRGQARLSFLTPGGIHFGQGPFDVFSRDAVAGPVFQRAATLMTALIAKTRGVFEPRAAAN